MDVLVVIVRLYFRLAKVVLILKIKKKVNAFIDGLLIFVGWSVVFQIIFTYGRFISV